MRKKLTLAMIFTLLLGLMLAGVALAQGHGGVHWGYEGEAGPEHWGELSPDFAACSAGKEQSPIDIPASAAVNPADLAFNYKPTAVTIVNNGHAIQVNYDAGSSIEVDGITYKLLQFHFHALSEHTVKGEHADMEMHLVHQNADGGLAVVGVLINKGAENPAYAPVWNHLPAEEGEPETISDETVNVNDLLPADRSYYRYNGSLTTPPCTEGVKWLMMTNPVELSEAQVAAFDAVMYDDYRPVQPFNARAFLLSSEVAPAVMPTTGGDPLATAPFGLVLAGMALLGIGLAIYAVRRRQPA